MKQRVSLPRYAIYRDFVQHAGMPKGQHASMLTC
jgi:hypothetical protein